MSENIVVEALHLSPLHTVEQLRCVGRPKDVPHWVGTVILPQVQGVQLVGEEAYIVAVHQHRLGGERVGGVEVQVETYDKPIEVLSTFMNKLTVTSLL